VAERPAFTHRRERRGLVGPFTGRQLLSAAALIAAAAVGLVVLTTPLGPVSPIGPGAPEPTQFVLDPNAKIGVRPGQIAPELAYTQPDGSTVQLTDTHGRPVRLADLRGKAVWLNFWASWCPPCQAETPVLREVFERHKPEGLALVAIAVQETTPDDVRAYAATYGLDYTIGFDATSAIFHRYAVFGLPTQFFIDRSGVVRTVVLGPVDVPAAERNLAPILAPAASPASSPATLPSATP